MHWCVEKLVVASTLTRPSSFGVASVFIDVGVPALVVVVIVIVIVIVVVVVAVFAEVLPRRIEAANSGCSSFRTTDLQTFLFGREVVLVAFAAVEGERLAAVGIRVVVPTSEHATTRSALM